MLRCYYILSFMLLCITTSAQQVSSETKASRRQINMQLRLSRAEKIANRISDSLRLKADQRNKLLKIESDLERQKFDIWEREEKDKKTIGIKLREVEINRDFLYKEVMTNEQYKQYLAKKRILLNNN